MPNTFELIASSTVGASPAATIDFSSIPSSYTDLCLVTSLRTNENPGYGWSDVVLSFNGSTASRTSRTLTGNGSTASSFSNTTIITRVNNAFTTSSTFSNGSWYVPNYAGSTNKSLSVDMVTENNATAAVMDMVAGLWSNTAAINQITITGLTSSFVQYSTAYLYGVKNA
jgi:hypothetical protein